MQPWFGWFYQEIDLKASAPGWNPLCERGAAHLLMLMTIVALCVAIAAIFGAYNLCRDALTS
jgi:hypothetical protein